MCSLKIKVFSSVLAFIMVVSAFPVYAFISYAAESAGVPPVNILSEDIQGATEPEELSGAEPMAETDFTYTIANDEVTISGYTGTDAEVLIPEEIESFPVTAVAVDAFKNNTVMETVVIPACVETIGSSAFEGSSVKFVTVFGGTVGDNAFKSCLSLQLMALGDGVTNVSSTAFLGCSSLTSITVTQDNAVYSHIDGVLFNDAATALLCYPAAKSNVVYFVPDTVAEIAADAFYGTRFLSNIVIKGNVTTISGSNLGRTAGEPPVNISGFVVFGYTDTAAKTYADTYGITFYNLGSASSSGFTYTVSNNCATITGYTASYSYVIIPAVIEGYPVTAIAAQAFNGKKYIGAVYIPDSVTTIGKSAFSACAELSNVRLSKGLVKLGGDAFTNCDKITEIEIPKSLTTIDTNTSILWFEAPFEDCNGLKTVTFESGATKVTSFLFARCPGIERVVIPDTVTVIEDMAFYEAINLRSITFSQSLTSIGESTFTGCASLESIDIPDSVTIIGKYAFSACSSLTSATLSNTLLYLPDQIFYNCISLTSVDLPLNLTLIGSSAFYNCSALTAITLPEKITVINGSVFYNCDGLTEIVIPEGVTDIYSSAFYDCDSLTDLVLPSSLNKIWSSAFRYCDLLKNITFGNKLVSNTTSSIDSYAFADCPAIESLTLPRGMATVGQYAFLNDIYLTSLHIPVTVTSIDATAISYPSRLTIFGVSGSYAQTYAIQKGANFTDIANHIDGLILKDNPDERYEMVKGEYLVPEFEFSTEFEGETTDVIILTSSHSRVTINNNRLYAANTGEATITATTSGGLTYQFTVYVRSVSSIAVTTPPLKMEYAYGEALDLAGMVVTATYNDSFSQPVTGYTISGYNPAVYGNQTVTVTYAAKTATFIVMVVDDRVYVTSIAVTTPPNKTTYIKGELLNTAGMVVTATYTDASTGPVTGFTVTGYNKLKLGAQTLTVTYADPTTAQIFTTTFQVTVVLEIVQVLTPVAGSGCVVDFANRYIYGLTPGTISLQGFAETTAGYEIVCIPTALGFGTGTVVNVMLGGSIVESYTVVIFGDINGDGSIDSIDAGNMVDYENYMVTWDPLIDAAKIKAADLNGDGTIDSIDAGIAVDAENYMVTIDQSTGLVAGG